MKRNNTIGVAIFVKTPTFSPIKTRLAKSINKTNAKIVFDFLVSITKELVDKITLKDNIHAYWAVSEKNAIELGLWTDLECLWQGTGDLGERLFNIQNQLFEKHDHIIFIGADAPLLQFSYFDNAISFFDKSKKDDIVIGPCLDGGFYLYGASLKRSLSEWQKIQYSCENTAKKLISTFCLNSNAKLLDRSFDIDTYHDLELTYQLMQKMELTTAQAELFKFLKSMNFQVASNHQDIHK